ncbi:glutamine--fructose-6-phosphate transaminase (isomerizing) [candidate division WOR-3 bacterium JGI_Cruoil_03_44_89]|uniref:Glutamine--fructose-6-phosphate aminotransferase [isomerizing] n=1 Tax=candidate division WOR-3 bacterium JGI_Cruoil_03_44_89 TaxID=1973748 RepID=A0A235BR79_UNCW3|nr:MAG: glutamine--fructose-6-phosphate transaminase (isomerizing) [candidate division WOR-3 bacterium JGI_Cruoil_03_44_89]
MCGIVGYIGKKDAVSVLIDGLKRLEYRGYDSAGIAVISKKRLIVQKKSGRIGKLEKTLSSKEIHSTIGIAHTRWATHGEPTDANAHPHVDCKGEIAVVHNGIIENYNALREFLSRKGHTFRTATDTEVIAHLVEEHYAGDLLKAVRFALAEVEGTYGIAVVHKKKREIVVARNGSPLVIGQGKNEYFVASDIAAIIRHTREVVYLEDGELARITDDGFSVTNLKEEEITPKIEEITWTLGEIERDGFSHFMLKEIFEQPNTIRNATRGRLNFTEATARLDGLDRNLDALREAKRIILTGCGTAWHAALVGEYMIEDTARIPCEVEYASEFRYRSPVLDESTVVFAISQSGETADTLAAVREAKRKGALALGICNVVGSSIARETDGGVYIHAGPEIGVASTKAFTSQLVVLSMVSLLLGRIRQLSFEEGKEITTGISELPSAVERVLELDGEIGDIAKKFCRKSNVLFLARGYNYPIALEGALKLKEISYIHAEGYPAAEMKHGPIALIDENMPVVIIATRNAVYDKIVSNIQEVKCRKGVVIAVVSEGDEEIKKLVDYAVEVPETIDILSPILTVIPLQLLAYHIAVMRGLDVDKPRNLAKSVTVE